MARGLSRTGSIVKVSLNRLPDDLPAGSYKLCGQEGPSGDPGVSGADS